MTEARPPEPRRGFAIASLVLGIILSVLSVVLMPFVVGIIAAIAIPSFLRARVSANEAAAIGDVRTVLAAEAAYGSANNGHYGTLECLAKPSACLPGYSGPPMLDEPLATAEARNGYKRVFHAGPALASFAYVAIPVEGGRTGVRSFCGDASGRICYVADGSAPEVVDGGCPAKCPLLR